MQNLPETGFLKLSQIINVRDKRADSKPPTTPLIPVGRTRWYAGIKTGEFPAPVKLGNMSLWRVEDIRRLIERMGNANQ